MSGSAEFEEFDIGYLAGLVDGEGYIFVSYVKDGDRTRPNLRIYCTSKPIIERASRIMRVNPCGRRDEGNLAGWIAAATGGKAIETLRRIAPYLTDPSKKCRAFTILKVFDNVVSIKGKHPSSQVFAHCPPPARLRTKVQDLASAIDAPEATNDSETLLISQNSQLLQVLRTEAPAEVSVLTIGWLCGMVDDEGHIHIRYRSDRDSMYPRLRIFSKTKPIIDAVAESMGVNPYARRSHGRHLGWYASVSHMKALRILRLIAPYLMEPSKRCRARRILDVFGEVGTVHSRLDSSDFFHDCPPPSRVRKSGRIINSI
jgi:hypothetical protein